MWKHKYREGEVKQHSPSREEVMKWSLIQTFFAAPIQKSWPFSSRWRNLVRFEWHLRMRGMSRQPRFLAPPIPSVLWPRWVTEMSRNPEYATSGPHARQPVQFSSLRHISLAKNKFLLFFYYFTSHFSRNVNFFIRRPGGPRITLTTPLPPRHWLPPRRRL